MASSYSRRDDNLLVQQVRPTFTYGIGESPSKGWIEGRITGSNLTLRTLGWNENGFAKVARIAKGQQNTKMSTSPSRLE